MIFRCFELTLKFFWSRCSQSLVQTCKCILHTCVHVTHSHTHTHTHLYVTASRVPNHLRCHRIRSEYHFRTKQESTAHVNMLLPYGQLSHKTNTQNKTHTHTQTQTHKDTHGICYQEQCCNAGQTQVDQQCTIAPM